MMKKVATVLLLFSFVTKAFSQQLMNSLPEKQLEHAKSDTDRVKILNDLSATCEESNADKGMNYAVQGLNLSARLRWDKGKAISYRHIGNCYYFKSYPDSAVACFEKSLHLAQQIHDAVLIQDALYALSFVYIDNYHKEYTKALSIRLQSLELYKQRNDSNGILKMLMMVGETYAKAENYDTAILYWLNAVNLKKQTGDTAYLVVYQNIAIAYRNQSRWQEAIKYFQMGVSQSICQNNKGHAGHSLRLMALCYQSQQDFGNALKTFESALSTFRQIKDWYGQALVLNNIGNLYLDRRQDYPNAIRYELLSLEIADSIKSKELIATNENDLAINYTWLRDYDKALDLFLKASVIFEELKAKEILAGVYRNTGAVYQLKGEKDKAEYYIQKSLQNALSNSSTEQKVSHLNDLGLGYLKNEKPAEAFNLFRQALLLCRQSQDKSMMAMTLGNMALAYLGVIGKNELQKLPENLQFSTINVQLSYIISLVDSAIKLDTLIHDLNLLQAHYVILSTTYELKKDYKQALLCYKKYTFYKDSLFNGEKMKKIGRLESQLEINRRDAKIKQIEFENEVQRNRTKTTTSILLSTIVIAVVMFYFLNKRKKYKFQLKLLQVELQVSEAKQEALNAQMSDHFVGNAMHSIKIFIDDNDKDNAILYLGRFRQLTRRVIQNAPLRLVALEEDLKVLEDYIELEKLRFTSGTFSYDISVDPEIDAGTVLVPPMILQVVTENAIKHGFRKSLGGKLAIEISKDNNTLRCSVQDNGIGRKAAAYTRREDAASFGTSLAERLVRMSSNDAKQNSYKVIDLYDDDELPVGTRVEIILPYILND